MNLRSRSGSRTTTLWLALLGVMIAALIALSGCGSADSASSSSSASSSTATAGESTASESTSASSSSVAAEDGQITVTVNLESQADDHPLTETYEVQIPENATAYDALMATDADVQEGSGSYGKFIEGIDGLNNGDYGSMSGWTYTVNGEQPTVGCDAYQLSNGDVVLWTYAV